MTRDRHPSFRPMKGRGPSGWVESSWSGRSGTVAWTAALEPVAALYRVGSSESRRRAAASRQGLAGLSVIAIGNLTVGGTGKSSLARWLAAHAAPDRRAAILLRGYGGRRGSALPAVVPDFPGYPLSRAADRFGDEAASHRAALPARVAVVVGRDRHRAAALARDGYGASLAILDDGWEQGSLAWDELWVTIDAGSPMGNGRLLPAGPLRRPPETLREAAVVAFVQEGSEVPPRTIEWARRLAPGARLLRFRRVLLELSRVGSRPGYDASHGRILPPAVPGAAIGRAALLSGVGDPLRVAAFAKESGIVVVDYHSFPDHARVEPERLRRALAQAARSGAEVALITEKDEHRWMLPDDPPLPVRVIRTGLVPIDPVGPLPGDIAQHHPLAAPSVA